MKLITILAILFTLSGCTTVWSKNGSTEADLQLDSQQCKDQVEIAIMPGLKSPAANSKAQLAMEKRYDELFNNCMTSKGWTASTK
jgi:hypothetical protein